jgi:7-cyano-7-deazaguanine synthase
MDSAALMAWSRKDESTQPGYALTLDYGQRNAKEIQSAKRLAAHFEYKHIIIDISSFGNSIALSSALLNSTSDLDVLKQKTGQTPVAYVPGRNLLFVAIAASVAESLHLNRIWIGFLGETTMPDTSSEFVAAWNTMARCTTAAGQRGDPIMLEAPLIKMTKSEVVRVGMSQGAPFEKTWSCYTSLDQPCGVCGACRARYFGFKKAGYEDPLGQYLQIPLPAVAGQ